MGQTIASESNFVSTYSIIYDAKWRHRKSKFCSILCVENTYCYDRSGCCPPTVSHIDVSQAKTPRKILNVAKNMAATAVQTIVLQ